MSIASLNLRVTSSSRTYELVLDYDLLVLAKELVVISV
jgi:hypothetical protein